jgi:signal peptidase I
MSSILIALTGLVAPGFAQGLMSQRRAMAIVIGLVAACLVGTLLVPWAIYLALLVTVGAMIDAGLRHRRSRATIRWSWGYPLIAFGCAIALSVLSRALIVEAFRIPSSNMYPTLEIGDHVFASKLAMRWRGPERGEIIVFRMPCQPDRDYIKRVVAVENDTVEIRCGVVHVNGAPVPTTLVEADDRYSDRDESDGSRHERAVSRYRETIGVHTFEVFHGVERPGRDEARRAGATDAGGEDRDFPGEHAPSCSGHPFNEEEPAAIQRPGTIVTTDPAPTDPCKPHRHYVVPPGHVFTLGDNRDNSNDSRFWGSVPVENVKGRAIGIWLPLRRVGRIE